MSDVKLPIGTRIRFIRSLTEAACEDHPALIYAERGDLGEVLGLDCSEGHWVKRDSWPSPFGAVYQEEFEVFNEQ